MKKRLNVLMLCLVMALAITGCSNVNINIYNDENKTENRESEDFFRELEKENTFDALTEKYGNISYRLTGRYKDGSPDEYTIYLDEERYVQDDEYRLLIIEKDKVYGYDKVNDGPCNYLFPGNYDEFRSRPYYHSLFVMNEEEEIISREEKDGYIYLETIMPASYAADVYTSFGYSVNDADSIFAEYTIDAATMDILELQSYLIKGYEKTWLSGQVLDRECDEYVTDPELVEGVFGDDVRTVTAIVDAGTDKEREYEQSVTKGSLISFYFGDEFYQALYTDSDCVTPLTKADRSKDLTVYLKRRVDYSDEDNWAYYGIGDDRDADLFLICPTVDIKDEFNMSMDDEETKESFLGALNMERGIYEGNTRMYAPYYRHAAMKIYSMPQEEREPYLEYAYDDIAEAFRYYLENENKGRPIVLAGFSQGADMCYRLLADYFGTEDMQEKLVAVYALGWPCTEEMVNEYPQIRPASSETDTGVVISFDCEAEDVTDTFTAPAGVKAYAINPLNWTTDGTAADKSENLGACFPDTTGKITKEVTEFCGCYQDDERGVIKIPDIDPNDYPAVIPNLPDGAYHIYDYQFFYRNLEENVGKRISSFMGPRTGGGKPWIDSDIKENVTENTATDPTDDFHLYVNKDWILENEIPAGYMWWGASTERGLEVKEQCIDLLNDDGIEGHDGELIRTYNSLLLDWDAREKSGVSEIEEIYERILNIKDTEDVDELLTDKDIVNELEFFMKVGSDIDINDPDHYIVAVDTPDLLLDDPAEYRDRTEYGDIYYGFRRDVFVHIAERMGMSKADAGECFDDAISFETKLAENIYTTQEKKQADYFGKINNKMSLEDLTGHCSNFPLGRILKTSGYCYDGVYIVTRPDYFNRLDEVYTDGNIDEIRAFLLVNYLRGYAGSLDKEIYDYSIDARNKYFGMSGELPYEEMAYNAVRLALPASMQKVYVQKYGSDEDKEKVEAMCREVIDTYREMLADNEWISDEARKNAIKKLDKMTIHVAYPDEFADTSDIDLKGCSLIEAKRRIEDHYLKYRQSLVGKKWDKDKWADYVNDAGLSITDSNACYIPSDNSINIFIGIMGAPFYEENMSTEELYASMCAFLIGHEISHAFDNNGAQFDERGILRSWWTDEDAEEFGKRVKKADDHLDGIMAFGDEHVIGSNVDSEMIADITGMQCALRMASKVKGFDYDKFFRKYAQLHAGLSVYSSELSQLKQDEHPLDYLRTNVVVQQFDEFNETYGVKEGDNMYLAPGERMIIW
ncbi:MAG: DUF3089 domain-containing protein [Lachnospiraceae bacterium]|nr:DUF3089 domain-containing protein [Lachnospiraceae bacterium]